MRSVFQGLALCFKKEEEGGRKRKKEEGGRRGKKGTGGRAKTYMSKYVALLRSLF